MTSIHDQLETVRKPRVHIKYEVETEDGVMEKELPFVVGVMGDFTGNAPGKPLKPLSDRKFIQIDRDNFNDVMQQLSPGVELKVDNTLNDDNEMMPISLQFNSMEDFEPEHIVQQVPQLKKLLDARKKLRTLLTKTDRSEKLEHLLESVLHDQTKLLSLANELGVNHENQADG